MNKTIAVLFTELGARVLVNPNPVPKGAVVDPDLSAVANLPPHMWALVEGKVVKAEDAAIKDIEAVLHAVPAKIARVEALWTARRLHVLGLCLHAVSLVALGIVVFELVKR